MPTRFSIRYKFLVATMLLLAVCVGTYLALASYIFKEDKKSLVFDYNRSLVVNLASDLDGFFNSVADKLHLVATVQTRQDSRLQLVLNDLLSKDSELVWVGSLRFRSGSPAPSYDEYFHDKKYQATYGLEDGFFPEVLPASKPIPLEDIHRTGEATWSATLADDGPALVGFAKSVIEENEKGEPIRHSILIAYIRADRMIAALEASRPNTSVILNQRGEILAHADPARLRQQKLEDPELFNQARELKVRAQVLKYESGNESRFGAFAKSRGGRFIILSSISEAMAFRAMNDLVTRSLLFGSILFTLSFLIAIFFSRSLTRPIETLAGGMKKVAEGNLETKIDIHSRDEIASLASHFNQMILDLKKSRAELEEINRELEEKVKERTLQLEERNKAVKEAQETLLRTTRLAAVGEVAGLAAHEVLNPLTSIISRLHDLKRRVKENRQQELGFFKELFQNWKLEKEQGGFEQLVKTWSEPSKLSQQTMWSEDLANIEHVAATFDSEFKQLLSDSDFLIEESQRINRIVQSFRGMSAAKNDVKVQSAHRLCKRSVTIMQDLALKYKITIQEDYTAETDLVHVDEDEVIQALTNLIRNSIQSLAASQSASGVIAIRSALKEKAPGLTKLCISIRDNGAGLSPENANKLFTQKFTTKSKSEGTGIGLSLSRRLMRSFEGDLSLTWTEPGRGAEFTIELPLAQENRRTA